MIQRQFFRDEDAIQYLRDIGLVEITSEVQEKNGTRCFIDTKMSDFDGNATMYTFHTNGYFRRVTKWKWSIRWVTNLLNRKQNAIYGPGGEGTRKKEYIFSKQVSLALNSIHVYRNKRLKNAGLTY